MITLADNEDLLIGYDIESYYDDFIITFYEAVNRKPIYEFINTFTCNFTGKSLKTVIEEHIIMAYNAYQYDDLMLTYMLDYEPSPRLLNEYNNYLFTLDDRTKQFMPVHRSIKGLDLMQQLNSTLGENSGRDMFSLKHIMANCGYEVHETSVGFDINRKLTEEELRGEVQYCWNDTTFCVEEVYWTKTRRGYFMGKHAMVMEVIEAEWTRYTMDSYWFLMRLTEGSLVTQLFKGIRSTPISWDMDVPTECLNIWRENWFKKHRPAFEMEIANNDLVLGYGGAHGVHKKQAKFKNVYHIDVASMYPTTISNYRILGTHTPFYDRLIKDRVAIKHTEPQKADGKKRILNTTYGKLLQQGGKMANRPGGLTVCFRGQEAIFNLVLRLMDFGEICQINTDGVYFKPNSYDKDFENSWRMELEFWEDDFNMRLDVEFYKLLVQRDVNLYVAVDEDDHIKAKGSLGNYKLDDESGLVASNHKPYDNPIVNLALVNKFVYGIPLIDTITDKNNDIRMYQTVYQTNRTFPYISRGKDVNGALKQKVNRIINTHSGDELYKMRYVDSEIRRVKKKHKNPHQVGDMLKITSNKTGYNVPITGIEDNCFIVGNGELIPIKKKHYVNVEPVVKVGDTYKGVIIDTIKEVDGKWFINGKACPTDDKYFKIELDYKVGDLISEDIKEVNEFEIIEVIEEEDGYVYLYEYPAGYRFTKITNLSKSATIINGDVRGKVAGDFDLDYGYYLALAEKAYRKFHERRKL